MHQSSNFNEKSVLLCHESSHFHLIHHTHSFCRPIMADAADTSIWADKYRPSYADRTKRIVL